jgi:hypothetical protein
LPTLEHSDWYNTVIPSEAGNHDQSQCFVRPN